MKTNEEVWSIVNELKALYPDSLCSLEYEKDYELLFSVRLAAQCTDERVNKVTPALFARFPTLESLAQADVAEVEQYIHSTGFFRAKARDIVLASQMLLRDYGGKVPGTMEELLSPFETTFRHVHATYLKPFLIQGVATSTEAQIDQAVAQYPAALVD